MYLCRETGRCTGAGWKWFICLTIGFHEQFKSLVGENSTSSDCVLDTDLLYLHSQWNGSVPNAFLWFLTQGLLHQSWYLHTECRLIQLGTPCISSFSSLSAPVPFSSVCISCFFLFIGHTIFQRQCVLGQCTVLIKPLSSVALICILWSERPFSRNSRLVSFLSSTEDHPRLPTRF